jgi:hypothetical protein
MKYFSSHSVITYQPPAVTRWPCLNLPLVPGPFFSTLPMPVGSSICSMSQRLYRCLNMLTLVFTSLRHLTYHHCTGTPSEPAVRAPSQSCSNQQVICECALAVSYTNTPKCSSCCTWYEGEFWRVPWHAIPACSNMRSEKLHCCTACQYDQTCWDGIGATKHMRQCRVDVRLTSRGTASDPLG